MPFPQEQVTWIIANQAKIRRYAYIAQAFTAMIFLLLGYVMGHQQFHLIRKGVSAPGTIVGYKQKYFRDSSRSFHDTGYMPVVQFTADGRVVQFEDWLGSNTAGAKNQTVAVLYDPMNPSVAMIDRPVWNWLPWGPVFGLGIFLSLVALKGWIASLQAPEQG